MIHLKLDATDSTNSFLRELVRDGNPKNWTIVSTQRQTQGRGQQGADWFSDEFKNLTFSILVKDLTVKAKDQFLLSCAVSVGLFNALEQFGLPRLQVKWPNDIMSGSSKIAGILIENSVMNEYISHSIVGIGLNVNQDRFPEALPGAASMLQLTNRAYDLDQVLKVVVEAVRLEISALEEGDSEILHSDYEKVLYRRNRPAMFRKPGGEPFLGQILGVTGSGMLVIKNEAGSLGHYAHKEIKYL